MEVQAMSIREQQWLQTIHTARQSGLNNRTWCKENGVAISTFYKWQRVLREKILSQQEAGGVTFAALPSLAQMQIVSSGEPQSGNSNRMVLCLGDVRVELPLQISEAQLTGIVRGIRNAG